MRTPPKSSARLSCCLAIMLTVFAVAVSVPANATPPAAFTTFDTSKLGCLDGAHPNGIDCNNYAAKEDVYINGGPNGLSGLANGSYYFVVLVPGFQNGGFIDGAGGNLSDVTASLDNKSGTITGAGGGDDVSNRTFTVSGGVVSYSGTHALGTDPKGHSVIQLMPYDDTTNMGGVYILGICQTGATSDSQCKFDAFKVKATTVCTTNCPQQTQGTVSVCKFWDQNFDHTWDNDEPFIGAWPINAATTGGDSAATLDASSKDTDNSFDVNGPGPAFGCTTFTVTWPSSDTSPTAATVTLSEGSAPDSSASPASEACNIAATTCNPTPTATWTQSAPFDGTNVLTSEDVSVSPNQNVPADNFGNFFGQDLTVTKTATPSFTRTYNWTLTKSLVSPTGNPVEESGSSVTITYSVVASETGFVDSAWSVAGSITVSNPNAFDVTGVTVADAVNDGGNCSVTDVKTGLNETVPANGTLIVPYTCSYGSAPAPPNTGDLNTATASWTGFGTPHSSAQGTASYAFTTPTTSVNKSVTITDCFNGCNGGTTPTTLGTLSAVDTCTGLTPVCTTHTYTVKQTVTITSATCATFTNTATITSGTTLSYTTPTVTVTICNENTGALTMGFWQNKNGQGIITKYCGGINGTSLHTFLTSFHPFSDETATTCSGEATYVYNVIKAATCGGSTCNAMLKAQMLATALDVYFSDGVGLGGNRIGAPAALASLGGIGTVSIDLSKICNMIDGSGGTASCSGTTSNVASLFGVTKCDTVSAMLAYQNISDPLADAGAVWYLNNKTSQVGAKNAFDAINNTVAPICP
jgi:hypothetical protein